MRAALGILCGAILAACSSATAPAPEGRPTATSASASAPASSDGTARSRTIRWTGMRAAVRSPRVTVPQVTGPTFRMTLTRLVPIGSTVAKGDLIAEFDPLEQLTQARESAARHDDLSHQVRQR